MTSDPVSKSFRRRVPAAADAGGASSRQRKPVRLTRKDEDGPALTKEQVP